MHTIIRAWSVFCAFLPLQLARWHWLKEMYVDDYRIERLLQLARWHWLKVLVRLKDSPISKLQLARWHWLKVQMQYVGAEKWGCSSHVGTG